ncbi:helix-turn-helix domain-containing protein [Herbaspirillum frisingense]|uniref:helix-turn-helix domain-containing protein n=1 Tax=Herbaspirillum frisingense TaxID=92645 RepID=UPI00286AA4FB|nr:helix-turn-helix transcriptional regulator [Herbaspirillum frisingense]
MTISPWSISPHEWVNTRVKSLSIRFGERIRELRKGLDLSQEEFADLCGFDRTYVSGIERGVRNPSLSAIETLAKSLRVSAGQLFDGL